MEDYFKYAWRESHKYKKVPAMIGGNYIKFLQQIVEVVEKKGFSEREQEIAEFFSGDNIFYHEILKESAVFFGAENFVQQNDCGMFITIAGRPHMDKSEFLSGEKYWNAHDKYFGTHIEEFTDKSVYIAPHHVVWLLKKNSPVSWSAITQKTAKERDQIFSAYSRLIEKNRESLKKISDKEILTSIAVGFEKEIDPGSPQTEETIHVHNIAVPSEDLTYDSIPASSEIRRKDIINPYVILIRDFFSEEAKNIIDESLAGTKARHKGSKIVFSPKLYKQVSFDIEFEKDTFLKDILEGVASIYNKLQKVWLYAQGQKKELPVVSEDESFQRRLAEKIAGLQNKPTRRFPKVPAFNVIVKWNRDNSTIDSVSISPSNRGPGEKIRGSALIRK